MRAQWEAAQKRDRIRTLSEQELARKKTYFDIRRSA